MKTYTESELLEVYYNTRFYGEGMPSYSQLDEDFKQDILNSYGFALAKLNNAKNIAVQKFLESINMN